jgi:succinylglutamate desuccinylase
MSKENEIAIIDNTISDIRRMVEESVAYQTIVTPVYASISKKILEMFDKDEELRVWQVKDLMKLLEISNKAQLQPIEQLTKLVQSVEALYDRSELQSKMDELSDVVNEIKEAKDKSNEHLNNNVVDYTHIEDVE